LPRGSPPDCPTPTAAGSATATWYPRTSWSNVRVAVSWSRISAFPESCLALPAARPRPPGVQDSWRPNSWQARSPTTDPTSSRWAPSSTTCLRANAPRWGRSPQPDRLYSRCPSCAPWLPRSPSGWKPWWLAAWQPIRSSGMDRPPTSSMSWRRVSTHRRTARETPSRSSRKEPPRNPRTARVTPSSCDQRRPVGPSGC